MEISKITLSFNGDLEQHFLDHYFEKNKTQIRIALVIGMFIYAAFGFLDSQVIPEYKTQFHALRFLLVIPLAYIALLLSYLKNAQKFIQPLLGLAVFVGGIAIVYMITIAPQNISDSYYAGLMLIFIYGYAFLRVRFVYATAAGWLIVAAYEISSIYIIEVPYETFINNNFFFITANLLGMFSSYTIEYFIRKEFIASYQLEKERKKVIEVNQNLEQTVDERTVELKEAMKKVEKLDQMKTEFIHKISHEIRTPINVVQSVVEILKEDLDDENQSIKDSIEILKEESQKLIRTATLILNISEIKSDLYEAEFKEIDIVEQILNPVYLKIRKEAEDKKFKLEVENTSDRSLYYCDSYSTMQIIYELLNNAVKFTLKGKIKVIVRSTGNGSFSISINDTGIGMSKEFLQKSYLLFLQEENSYTREFEGLGLGLTLVKDYCKLNKIDISVERQKNLGTQVTLLFNNGNQKVL